MHSNETMHAELAKTVEDLGQWLNVVEVGLKEMLESAGEPTIEEEQEQEDGSALSNRLAAFSEFLNP